MIFPKAANIKLRTALEAEVNGLDDSLKGAAGRLLGRVEKKKIEMELMTKSASNKLLTALKAEKKRGDDSLKGGRSVERKKIEMRLMTKSMMQKVLEEEVEETSDDNEEESDVEVEVWFLQ